MSTIAPFITIKAVEIGFCTLVGFGGGKPPFESGNCFSLIAENGHGYRIANFNYENMKYLLSHGVPFPIEIHVLSEDRKIAVIHDARIPNSWYSNKFCEICCSEAFLPITQLLQRGRERLQGVRQDMGKFVRITPGLSPKIEVE